MALTLENITLVDQLSFLQENSIDLQNRTIFLENYREDKEEEPMLNHYSSMHILKAISILNKFGNDTIKIILNTPGGIVDEGMAIYDAMKSSNSPIDVEIYGRSMSMGAIILQAGRERLIHPNAHIMIHNLYGGPASTAKSNINWAKQSIQIQKKMYKILEKRTNKSAKYWEDGMAHDMVFNSRQAKKVGLVDRITSRSL